MRYRHVPTGLWTDPRFVALSPTAKLIVLQLHTSQYSTPFGCYRAPLEALASEIGLEYRVYLHELRTITEPQKSRQSATGSESMRFASLLRRLKRSKTQPLIQYDNSKKIVYIPGWFSFMVPGSPNVLKSWLSLLDEIDDCPAKMQCLGSLHQWTQGRDYFRGLMDEYLRKFGKGFPKALRKALNSLAGTSSSRSEPSAAPPQPPKGGVAPGPSAPPPVEKQKPAVPAEDPQAAFARAFKAHRKIPYVPSKRDPRAIEDRREGIPDFPATWPIAVANYFKSSLKAFRLTDLCRRYDVFLRGPIDRYGQPKARPDTVGSNHEPHEPMTAEQKRRDAVLRVLCNWKEDFRLLVNIETVTADPKAYRFVQQGDIDGLRAWCISEHKMTPHVGEKKDNARRAHAGV